MHKLEKIDAYKNAAELSDLIWNTVTKWDILAKKTIGDQLIRSCDSISANIAEAEGRYFKKDKIRFFYQTRGSLYEVIDWINKAKNRNLISNDNLNLIENRLNLLPKQIHSLILGASKNLSR